jgi:hypothetical protein
MNIDCSYKDKNKVFSKFVNETLNHLFIELYNIQIQFIYYKILILFRLNGITRLLFDPLFEKAVAY